MKKIICLAAVLLVATVAMFADIARPGKQTKPVPKPGLKIYSNSTADMTIRFDSNIERPTLRIPKTQLNYLRAQNENGDVDENDTAAVSTPGGFSRTQTFASGALLSLALVFGGMWFVRSGKAASKEGKALVILAVLAGIGSAATFTYADIAPPPAVAITSRVFNGEAIGYGQLSSPNVRVESSSGDDIELFVPVEKDKPAANVTK